MDGGTGRIRSGYCGRNTCATGSSRLPERPLEKLDSAENEVVSIDPEAGLITGMDAAATTPTDDHLVNDAVSSLATTWRLSRSRHALCSSVPSAKHTNIIERVHLRSP
ncbi:hypothetical protein Aduo_005200 [Ancylostoma duodenale]